MATFQKILITSMCAVFAATAVPATSFAAKAAKKDKRSMMSEEQKKKLRREAREYCNKTYAKGGAFVESVDIQSTGKVICWIRG